jgi:hypothetical protein
MQRAWRLHVGPKYPPRWRLLSGFDLISLSGSSCLVDMTMEAPVAVAGSMSTQIADMLAVAPTAPVLARRRFEMRTTHRK